MMSNGNGNFGRNYRFPFTANQWQELEHQALIFKYMVSGMPIPPDLLYSVRRSFDSSSSSSSSPSPSSKLFLHQPHQHIGWNCFQMGFGRKIDPEPGRCRRTDGKKWRCSKEAYPDSKYCERHMHRGRNRSRKPVEIPTTTTAPPPPPPLQQPAPPPSSSSSSIITKNTNQSSTSSSPNSHSLSCLTSLASSESHLHHHQHHHHHNNPFLYTPHSSSRPHSGIDLSSQENTTTANFLLESGNNNNYSHANGKSCYSSSSYGQEGGHNKEEVDEHVFFSSEVSESGMRNVSETDSWQLTMGSPLKHRSSSSSYLQLNDNSRRLKQDHHQNHHQHHYYGVLGGGGEEDDIKNDTVIVPKKKVMHHFFDEWPPKDKDSWIDDDDEHDDDHSSIKLGINRNHHNPHLLHHHNHQQAPASKIQLSISMPSTNNNSISHDFFMTRNGT